MSEGLNFKTEMQFAYGVPSEMAPGVARLVANNASALTFKGTNTYLVGTAALAVIDPGPSDPDHLTAILKAAGGHPITHILVTHAHRDHVDGLSALQARTGAKTCAFRRQPSPRTAATEEFASEYVNQDFSPDIEVCHGDRVTGEDWELLALHTPGHAPDHLCFALEGRGVVFSGDHVMAWNTSVVAPPEGRMADYLRSLELLLERGNEMLLPGHGGRILESRRIVKAYLLHRRWREQAILEAVRQGTNTVRKLLPVIYRELDEDVVGAAKASLRAHIEHLAERGLIACDDVSNDECVAVPL
jgi:glyoxylase-like metal-dependent hydrolase (beta-lactamase superfamily II)